MSRVSSLTLRQLEVFLTVADTLHFGRAAERLHISQPTVSQEVARLERAVGVELFDRSRRSVRLTSAGEVMAAESARLLDQAGTLLARVRLHEEARLGTARIVASPTVVNRLLPAVVSRAERELPELVLAELSVDTGRVSATLAGELADLGLGRFLDDVPGYRRERIADEPVRVALSRDHPLAGRDAVRLDELGDLPLLLWPREQSPRYYDHVLGLCAERGVEPPVLVGPARIVGSRLYLLSQSRAFSLVPASMTGHLTEDVVTVRLAGRATLPLELQWRLDDRRPGLAALRELVREEAAALETC
ncbi:LysR substrate-binding domain-containing protein [Kitasatospora purpeofusca]|uniref:LysR substrate-binding domain-containing protein n=1 Tax=Kitasatospora purpeofusca TaxID=67352 RepID=UPI002A5AB050|nr:LysR substrate-binding domain-containing protein [Kitasatospora purpeofusca]MDY0812589.1 LysR substrate-binding domain-containing protein [Kitasatospora purpeofusca]